MGAWVLLHDDGSGDIAASLAQARTALARRGFRGIRSRQWPGWHLLHADAMQGAPAAFLERGEDLVAVAGTPVCAGAMGEAALATLLGSTELPQWRPADVAGQFAAVVRRGNRTFLFTDALGAFQLYRDAEAHVISTSFLAAIAALPSVTFDAQGVYEFAFNVAPVGDDTVLSELKTLGPGTLIELTAHGAREHPLPQRSTAQPAADVPLPERLDGNAELLIRLAREQVDHFGDAMHVPLSGGIDSRLVLAALRACGARPQVYVYGSASLADVTIARGIGQAEGFAVECIDRTSFRCDDPERFAALTEETFHQADGLPNFGNIFDAGANLTAQIGRHAPGHLAVSGGGGEVYRDFFRLPDRPLPVADVASAFFARFSARDATDRFDAGAFLHRIGRKMADALDVPDPRDTVPRALLEQLYPKIRCRALFGRELTIEAGYGSYFLPFLDHRVIAQGSALPMAAKHNGRFEAALLAAIDPALARHTSTYGHSFVEPPSRSQRVREWVSRRKPTWVRRHSYALQRMLPVSLEDDHGGPVDTDLIARTIDLRMPIMRAFFDIDRIAADRALWYRVACLEYFAAAVGAR